jgi:hypothetical protein
MSNLVHLLNGKLSLFSVVNQGHCFISQTNTFLVVVALFEYIEQQGSLYTMQRSCYRKRRQNYDVLLKKCLLMKKILHFHSLKSNKKTKKKTGINNKPRNSLSVLYHLRRFASCGIIIDWRDCCI